MFGAADGCRWMPRYCAAVQCHRCCLPPHRRRSGVGTTANAALKHIHPCLSFDPHFISVHGSFALLSLLPSLLLTWLTTLSLISSLSGVNCAVFMRGDVLSSSVNITIARTTQLDSTLCRAAVSFLLLSFFPIICHIRHISWIPPTLFQPLPSPLAYYLAPLLLCWLFPTQTRQRTVQPSCLIVRVRYILWFSGSTTDLTIYYLYFLRRDVPVCKSIALQPV